MVSTDGAHVRAFFCVFVVKLEAYKRLKISIELLSRYTLPGNMIQKGRSCGMAGSPCTMGLESNIKTGVPLPAESARSLSSMNYSHAYALLNEGLKSPY